MSEHEQLVESADLALIAAGAVISAWVVIRWWRAGRRDPLRSAPALPESVPLLAVWVCVLAFFASGMIAGLLGPVLIPDHLAETVRKHWTDVATMTLTQLFTAIICGVVLAMRPRSPAGRRPLSTGDLGWGVAAWLCSLYLCTMLAWYSLWVIDCWWPGYQLPEHTIFTALNGPDVNRWMRWLALASAGLIAPIAEEMFFRGVIQSTMRNELWKGLPMNTRRWLAILATAVIFGMMHGRTPHYIPALIVLGVILGYVYERRGNLAAPIVLHILFNAKALTWHYLSLQQAQT